MTNPHPPTGTEPGSTDPMVDEISFYANAGTGDRPATLPTFTQNMITRAGTAAFLGTAPVLTPTCQPDNPTIGRVVDALETAWTAIRTQNPELPTVVIIVASGSPAKANQPMRWGHFATARWQHADNVHAEVMVSGEGLKRSAAEVFTTLLHEAAHGLADVRNIKDTSRQGRWHNKHFAKLAGELGMTTTKDNKLGFSPCQLTEIAAARYRTAINAIDAALTLYRHSEEFEVKEKTNSNNGVVAQCLCPRKLRVSNKVFDAGVIRCDECEEAFLPEDIDRDTFNANVANPYHLSTVDNQGSEGDDGMVFYDPTGARHGGLPTYPYRLAPAGLATTRQLRANGLRPGGQNIAAQILWRQGKRRAYLYRLDQALPKRTATPAQLAALQRAMHARRTCPTCTQVKDYYIPRRDGECRDCAAERQPVTATSDRSSNNTEAVNRA